MRLLPLRWVRPTLCSLVASVVLGASALGAQQRGTENGEWRVYHGDYRSTRYSPLDQITANNFNDLEIAWRWRAENFGPSPEIKNEVTPLMVNGTLYVQAGRRRSVAAIDAGTGETLWIWRMDEGERAARAPRINSGRGVAYWTDGTGDERIYTVTPGFHMAALDAKTGAPIPDFGDDGVVDLMRNWDGFVNPVGNLGSSSPVVIFGDAVIVGPALRTGFVPPSKENTPGHITAYDVRTGERIWTFHTIPQGEEEFGWDTWLDGSAAYTGNAGVWAPFSLDEELGYLYLPVEAATSDFYGGHRHGDNLFSSSLVALDAKTGERVWHYQIVHHDIWDYDPPTAPILLDVTVDGEPRKIVVQLTKQGLAFTFDRVTGEPIWPIEERPVPQTDVPGERSSPTQPFPTKPAPFDRQGISIDDLIDFTPELRAEALEIIEGYRLGPLYTPPSLVDPVGTQGTLLVPQVSGAVLWEHAAADPETGIIYVPTQTAVSNGSLVRPDPGQSNVRYIAGGVAGPPGPQNLPILTPPYGRITAIDMNTGEHLWMIPNGDTPEDIENHPALQGLDIPPTGISAKAGLLATGTLLIGGEGWAGRPILRAYDKQTGQTLGQLDLPANQTGLPMTYMHEGRQFIVFTVGGSDHPAEFIALALSGP